MTKKVSILKTNYVVKYPDVNHINNKNDIDDMIEQCLKLLELDKKNILSDGWNPFKDYIKPGNTVLIKPNMVMDYNANGLGEDCLYTNPSVVFSIIKYVVKALNRKGKIIVADAPVQQCDFSKLINKSGYKKIIDYYQSVGVDIELKDLRGLKSCYRNGILVQEEVKSNGIVVDLGNASMHSCNNEWEKLRITNYDPNELLKHHNKDKHEYYISKDALLADVIINVPKPKSHRKAGVTIGLKNFVGINVRKEYLPHHKLGDTKHGGDEYEKGSFLLRFSSKLKDTSGVLRKSKKYTLSKIVSVVARILSGLDKRFISKEKNREGSWYGNDTIWRTILDINKIITYADKNGKMCKTKQRKIINVADMVVVGEKEGPLLPTPKYCGVIVISDDIYAFDFTIATIMGFDIKKIPTLSNLNFRENIQILSNCAKWHHKKISNFKRSDTLKIEPSSGWKNHIELR